VGIPFVAGGVGVFSYDLGLFLEKVYRKNADDTGCPDVCFCFYDVVCVYDALKKEVTVFSWGFPEKKGDKRKRRAQSRLRRMRSLLDRGPTRRLVTGKGEFRTKALASNFTRQQYLDAVRRCRQYIHAGDIYQLNLSQRFSSSFRGDAFALYEVLRKISPSYFSLFFNAGDFCVLSSSPEEFLSCRDRKVTTVPMKGTRARYRDRKKDVRARNSLVRSVKERAELLMIVDLLRNDLGRVCEFGSVKVPSLRQIERYSTVYQATSVIEGVLQKGKDCVDLLRACFPGGSITGCPKIRAMQIIEELEPVSRSFYTGCGGYISFHDTMHMNILIRTLIVKKDRLFFSVGGGIVYDSIPAREYQETLIKAKGIFISLQKARL